MTSVSEAFLSKEVSHPLGNINVHPHLIHLSFAQLFFHFYTWWSPITTLCYTVHTTTVFYHYLKWKYKKRENGNIWAKRNSQHQPSPFHISAMYSAVKSFSISYVLLPCTPEPDRVGHYRENHRTTEVERVVACAVRVHFISRYLSLFARLCKSLI